MLGTAAMRWSMGALGGRVAVITGAGGGICAAIARLFVEEGAKVASLDLTAPEAAGDGLVLSADVSDERQTLQAVDAVLARWGAVHVLVNGAAPQDPVGNVLELPPSEWQRVFAVQVT